MATPTVNTFHIDRSVPLSISPVGDGVDNIIVASDTISLNSIFTCVLYPDHLGLEAECEHERVTQPVLSFEKVLGDYVIVGNVAIVADGKSPVTASLPGGKIRVHHVTIDAGFRFVGCVRYRIGNVEDLKTKTDKNAKHDDYRKTPLRGWN